ncbi:SRPBCC family protein [Actinoplanes sp. NPDC049265]|uniref:SRPBCC family protein n=1 Tax=Actinoplanes sp. NPDC049265 TaxID=3363902 RepID=UPI00371CBA2E
MIRVEGTRDFPMAAAPAFDYITDPVNWPDYWPDLIEVETPGASWSRAGDQMRLRLMFAGRPTAMRMTMETVVRPEVVIYDSAQAGLPAMRHERYFEARDSGLHYRIAVAYEPRPGLSGLLDRTLVRAGVRRVLNRTLDNLTRELTARAAPGGDSHSG